jgi:hypothetical protein
MQKQRSFSAMGYAVEANWNWQELRSTAPKLAGTEKRR